MTVSSRLQLSFECALVLFACSAGPGAALVWLNRAEAQGYWMVVGVPLCAAAAFLAISLGVPSLFAVPGLRFPLPMTLPLVYTCLLPVCSAMWTTTPVELVSNFEMTRFALVWQHLGTLLIVGGTQILGMVLLTALRRGS